MNNIFLPRSICFPRVTTVSLIRCDPYVIPRLIQRSIFPALKEIHYLSGAPLQWGDFHRAIPKDVTCIFPEHDYPFYNAMVESGNGLKHPSLISNYISKELKDDFELYIPNYTLLRGKEYRDRLINFLYSDTCLMGMLDMDARIWTPREQHVIQHPVQLYMKKQTECAFLKCIL